MKIPHTSLWNVWIPLLLTTVALAGIGVFLVNVFNPPIRWWGWGFCGVSALAAVLFKAIFAIIRKEG